MILIEKMDQIRRDFQGKYECQNCRHIMIDKSLSSYDDDYFHNQVIPNKKCEKCGKSTNDLGLKNERMATKYAPHEVI